MISIIRSKEKHQYTEGVKHVIELKLATQLVAAVILFDDGGYLIHQLTIKSAFPIGDIHIIDHMVEIAQTCANIARTWKEDGTVWSRGGSR
jgi:hypothetical protein